MGLIIFPVFRESIANMHPRMSGEFLAREFRTVDGIANEHRLPTLSAFTDQRAVPPDFGGAPWELDDLLGPDDYWFPAAEGRLAFSALARLIRERTDVASRLECPDEVAAELEDLAQGLAVAEGAGIAFRLSLS